jgi:hypothetical protein
MIHLFLITKKTKQNGNRKNGEESKVQNIISDLFI